MYDRLGQSLLGKVPELFAQQGQVKTIMDNHKVRVVGLFGLGSTVSDQGHIIMSDWNYKQQNGADSLDKVSVGVLSLKSGVSPQTVISRIKQNMTKDVKVMTREELMQAEQDYIAQWPEGKILNFGAAIGFIIGVVIVYQVLYTDVSEHLPEYATLKAIGYGEKDLLIVVLQEALILAVMGFIPGFFASYGVYHLLESITKIPLEMHSYLIWQIFLLTVIMCALSGALAVNKLRAADPADIFH